MRLESKKLLEDIRYDIVEDSIVWDVAKRDLPLLYEQVQALLGREDQR